MKILIVDHNNDTLEVLSLRVTKLGYEAIKAHSSKEAIAYAEAEPPDLIFIDMDLPDVDGAKTTTVIKRNPKTSHIPVVAVTAWMPELWRDKALKAGIVDYLLKPVEPQKLKQTIEQFANRSAISTVTERRLEEKEIEAERFRKPERLKSLSRLRMCLTKLTRPCEGAQSVEADFTLHPYDR